MATIFSRLNFNFDTAKLGDAVDPTGKLQENLEKIRPNLFSWQYEDLANNNVGGYLFNPTATNVDAITSAANSVKSFLINRVFETSTSALSTAADNLYTESVAFKAHTDRISGVTTTTNINLPDLNTGLGVGQFVQQMVAAYDGLYDNTPILGSFTSLFVNTEISSNTSSVQSVTSSLLATAGTGVDEETQLPIDTSNATTELVSSVTSSFTTAYNLLHTRRTHDITFYTNSYNLMTDYNKVNEFSTFSDLKLYLVNNYIGTEKLKNNL